MKDYILSTSQFTILKKNGKYYAQCVVVLEEGNQYFCNMITEEDAIKLSKANNLNIKE